MSKSDKIMDARTAAETALLEDSVAALLHDSMLVKYRPIRGTNSSLIKVVKTAEDPLQPPKFRYRKIPRAGRNSPPPVVLQSPPRQLTAEDIKNSRVPPCVSLWKNPKGYAIPLDKRHSTAVGLEAEISHRMADLAHALYVAEEKSRDEVALRSKMRRESEMREKERRDVELRRLARRVRDEFGGREGKKRRNVGGEESKKKKKKRSRREGGGLAASTEGEMMFDRRLVDAYGDGDRDGEEVKTMMKMRDRERPVEFEKEDAIPDLFGLDEFLSKLNH